jgi:predicted N-formylglutamate amidohydrolase
MPPQVTADPPPFRVLEPAAANAARGLQLVLCCDHASPTVPPRYGDLGLKPGELARHIAWDIGSAAVTGKISAALDVPAVLSGVSRLVIDCNRDPADPTAIPAVSDGTAVPGNQDLAAAEIAVRVARYHTPYHQAIAACLGERGERAIAPALIAIHSFTPALAEDGTPRPWHVGVLWDRDARLAAPLLAHFRAERGLVVGDNEPYSAKGNSGYTLRRHGATAGFPHVLIEIRQDLIAAPAGVAEWAGRLARAFTEALAAHGPFNRESF